jgi:hypothetical protein
MDFITDSYQVFPMAWVPKKNKHYYLLLLARFYWQWQQLWLQEKSGSGI